MFGCYLLTVTNTLAFYGNELITALKIVIVQAADAFVTNNLQL
jgi:hypothetical protein